MNQATESSRRFEEAEYDRERAGDVLASSRHNWACFISQQAAGRAPKAIYIEQSEEAERAHSIMALIKGVQHGGWQG